jgi:hypothetical protein
VKRAATPTLHSGKYFVDTLELEPGAKVVSSARSSAPWGRAPRASPTWMMRFLRWG